MRMSEKFRPRDREIRYAAALHHAFHVNSRLFGQATAGIGLQERASLPHWRPGLPLATCRWTETFLFSAQKP